MDIPTEELEIEIGVEACEHDNIFEVVPDAYFDPFKLCYVDCYDSIFKYLEVKDLLALAETCSSFYTITANSPSVMDRIKLVIIENHYRRFSDTLFFTNRRYRHVEILGLYESTREISMLLEFCSESLKTIKTCYDIGVTNSLKSLVEIVYYGSSKITIDRFGLIAAAVNLKRLIMWSKVENPGYLADFIRESKTIEKLVLEQQSSSALIQELDKFRTFDCALKTLHLDLNSENLSGSQYEIFLKFVLKQRQSLRDIKFCGNVKQLSEILKALPLLERITFAMVTFSPYYYAQIPYMRHIKEANLIHVSEEFVKQIVEINPQFELLYVSELTKNMLKQILAFSRKLKVLKFASLKDCTLDELKRFYEVINNVMQVKNNSSIDFVQI